MGLIWTQAEKTRRVGLSRKTPENFENGWIR